MRVNFSTGNPEREHLPFCIAIIADFCCERSNGETTLVDARDFRNLLRRCAPTVRFQVPNLLADGKQPLDVALTFSSMRDFSPENVVQQIPELKKTVSVLQQLARVGSQQVTASLLSQLSQQHRNMAALATALQASTTIDAIEQPKLHSETEEPSQNESSAHAGNVSVNRILDMVELPDTEQRAANAVGALLGHMAKKVSPSAKNANQASKRQSVQQRVAFLLSRQLDCLLHHPAFQRVESIWRGLRHLVSRTDFRSGIQLSLINANHTQVVEALNNKLDLQFRKHRTGQPGLVVIPQQLNISDDFTLLADLAVAADTIQAPVLFSIEEELADALSVNDDQDAPHPVVESWRQICDRAESRWLTAAFNPFLLRPLYGEELNKIHYAEQAAAPNAQLWIDPTWAIAGNVANSIKKTGWPADWVGPEQRIEDLAIWQSNSGRSANIPLRHQLSNHQTSRLSRNGVCALCTQPDTDWAIVAHAPVMLRESTSKRHRSVALPYQLFVSRIVHNINHWRNTQKLSHDSVHVQQMLEQFLFELIENSGPTAWVDVHVNNADEQLTAHVELQTGRALLGGTRVELDFVID